MLKDRLIVGVIGAALAVLILLTGEITLGIAVSLLAMMGLAEIYGALGFFKSDLPIAVIGAAASLASLIFCNFGNTAGFLAVIFIFLMALMVYMVVTHKSSSLSDTAMCFFATVYSVFLMAHLILIRKSENGVFLIWIPIITAWLSDTMAYTFGRLFGKHKLIPAVSPKKTVEGAAGGVVGGVVFMMVFGAICAFGFNMPTAWWKLVAVGLFGSIISQFGDLGASWIKREKGIKDFSNLLPGHGGVLDRFDSVLFTAPFVYYFNLLFKIF